MLKIIWMCDLDVRSGMIHMQARTKKRERERKSKAYSQGKTQKLKCFHLACRPRDDTPNIIWAYTIEKKGEKLRQRYWAKLSMNRGWKVNHLKLHFNQVTKNNHFEGRIISLHYCQRNYYFDSFSFFLRILV